MSGVYMIGGIPAAGAPSQPPVFEVPRNKESKRDILLMRSYDSSAIGVIALMAVGAVLFLFLLAARSSFWYLGASLAVLALLLFLILPARRRTHSKTR